MKFLLIVWTVRFLIGLLTNRKSKTSATEITKTEKVFHPAEFEVREEEIRIKWW